MNTFLALFRIRNPNSEPQQIKYYNNYILYPVAQKLQFRFETMQVICLKALFLP